VEFKEIVKAVSNIIMIVLLITVVLLLSFMLCTHDDVCYLLESICLGTVNDSRNREPRMKTHTSIVQKLISRSVTGRGLGIKVHTHSGWTVHVTWSPGAEKGSYNNCIARHTIQSGVWHDMLCQLRRGSLI
jgi:hypothetical protein